MEIILFILYFTDHKQQQQHQNRRPITAWQETNLDTGHTTDHGQAMDHGQPIDHGQMNHGDYDYGRGHYEQEMPLYVDTRGVGEVGSPPTSDDMQLNGFREFLF